MRRVRIGSDAALGLLRAIPSEEDIREGRRLTVIEGDVPDLSQLVSGCQFVERCTMKPEGQEELCVESELELETVATNHRVRCWIHSNGSAR